MIYPLLTYPSLPPKKKSFHEKIKSTWLIKNFETCKTIRFGSWKYYFWPVFSRWLLVALYSTLKIHPSFYILKDSHFLFQLSINDVLLRKCRIQHKTIKGSIPCQKVLGHKFKNMGDIKLGFNWSDLRKHSRINRVRQCQKYQICIFILLFAIFCIFPLTEENQVQMSELISSKKYMRFTFLKLTYDGHIFKLQHPPPAPAAPPNNSYRT